jgi:Uncharacterized protein conserved in bacteria (DUF2252)
MTGPGPPKRFAASVVVAARENRVKPARAAAAVTAGVEAYCQRISRYATMPELAIWYDGMHVDSLVGYFEPADRSRVSIHIERKRERRTSRGALAKLTAMAHGRPRITEDPPLRVTISDSDQADLVGHLLAGYRLTLAEDRRALFDRFTEVDMVRQVVGVGSGTRTSATTPSSSAPSPQVRSRASPPDTPGAKDDYREITKAGYRVSGSCHQGIRRAIRLACGPLRPTGRRPPSTRPRIAGATWRAGPRQRGDDAGSAPWHAKRTTQPGERNFASAE